MVKEGFYALRDSLRVLRDVLPELSRETGIVEERPALVWRDQLLHNVLPAMDFHLPVLLVAICGGGSTGKSTLFNVLAGAPLSHVGFRAGLTQRVLLAGHPAVLSGAGVAQSLLHRLQETPLPWQEASDTLSPGPPLYASAPQVPQNLLLIDTPDFDTGADGRLANRERAEPVLRTAEVIVYVFTNTVYSNLSNTAFMADIVGGIGGRPVVLVYRISRVASDEEVWEHCQSVTKRLYAPSRTQSALPEMVIGIYRMHESDAVAEGAAPPLLIPLGEVTRGRSLPDLLADLDTVSIKRHVLAGDLRAVAAGARAERNACYRQAQQADLYGRALRQAMAEAALEALRAFPAHEAIALATRLFLESSPSLIRALRNTGRIVGAPFRGLQWLGGKIAQWTGLEGSRTPSATDITPLDQALLLSANRLRNRLMDDMLIVRSGHDDPLLALARETPRGQGAMPASDAVLIEPLGARAFNLHFAAPRVVRDREGEMLTQDWGRIASALQGAARGLDGLPPDIESELRGLVARFRAQMSWQQQLREAFFASLSALPPLLGVTYTLLTADPLSGSGIWIQLQSVFGINDLWALVSIPASAGLSQQDRKQLQTLIAPVFRLWLERRANAIVDVYARTVCRPILEALQQVPSPADGRFAAVDRALSVLEGSS